MAKVDSRDESQQKAADLWFESNRRNTLLLGTGFGKSRVTMLILDKLFKAGILENNSKILLVSDSQKLRDTNWKDDFIKWDKEWMWNNLQSECYQTVYKWENTEWDIVICDEVDFALTDEYSKLFTNNKLGMILGLTGYVDDSKKELLDQIAPPVVRYSTQDAQRDGLLNKTQVVFVEYDLSRNPTDITVNYKKGGVDKSFTQSENDAYSYIEDKFNITWGKISKLRADVDVVMGLDDTKIKELNKLEYQLKQAIAKRKELLYTSKSSVAACKSLIGKVLESENNKVLTFSMLTDHADLINEHTYHGKNKKGNLVLDWLVSGEINSVGVCKAVNRGVNLPGVNNLVMESYDSSTTAFTQRHGRGTRLKPDQVMYLYVMLPYYHKKIKSPETGQMVFVRRPTQAVKWAQEMMVDYKFENAPMKIMKGVGANDWF